MRAVIQRVTEASVSVEGEVIGSVGRGFLVLLGVDVADVAADAVYVADKIVGLRIFNDADDKFNLSLLDVGGGVLVVSQFTLHGDCRKGRRPSFIHAARPEVAIPLYESVVAQLRAKGLAVGTGAFGANMQVALVNDGPVTILIDSRKVF